MKRNNFVNNWQMSWGYFYFIHFSFDQILNSLKCGSSTYISKLSIHLQQVNTKLWITLEIFVTVILVNIVSFLV